MIRLRWTGDDDIDRARYEDMRVRWACEDNEPKLRQEYLDSLTAARPGFDPLYPDGEHGPSLVQRQWEQEAWA